MAAPTAKEKCRDLRRLCACMLSGNASDGISQGWGKDPARLSHVRGSRGCCVLHIFHLNLGVAKRPLQDGKDLPYVRDNFFEMDIIVKLMILTLIQAMDSKHENHH